MELMEKRIATYKTALEIVRQLGQTLLDHSNELPDDIIEPIEEIDINIHYLLDCGKE